MPHTQEQAEAIFEPHGEALAGIFPAAWESWESFGETMPELRMQCCKRTRASMMSNFGVEKARVTFADMSPDVILRDGRKFLIIEFDSQLCLRLKKFQEGTRITSGISTRQRQAFSGQEPLTGMPEATNLVLGYELNADETQLLATAVTCKTHGKLHWEIEIPLPGETIFLSPSQPTPLSGPGVAQPEIASTRKEAQEGHGR